MNYNLTTPCDACPFMAKNKHGYSLARLHSLIGQGEFHCHKTGDVDDEGEDNMKAKVR